MILSTRRISNHSQISSAVSWTPIEMSAKTPRPYCSPEQMKRITEWIDDLHSQYSCKLAPSEPPTSERGLSIIGSSHHAISERFLRHCAESPTTRSSHAPRGKTSSKKRSSNRLPAPGFEDAEKPQDATSKEASAGGSSAKQRLSRSIPFAEGASQRMLSQKAPLAPAPSLGRSQDPHSGHSTHISPAPGLDSYSTALNEKLSHEHRQIEERARALVKRQRGESSEQHISRVNSRLHQLDDKLVDPDMKWRMLEMEKEAGLRG